jgi:hypothetical protein
MSCCVCSSVVAKTVRCCSGCGSACPKLALLACLLSARLSHICGFVFRTRLFRVLIFSCCSVWSLFSTGGCSLFVKLAKVHIPWVSSCGLDDYCHLSSSVVVFTVKELLPFTCSSSRRYRVPRRRGGELMMRSNKMCGGYGAVLHSRGLSSPAGIRRWRPSRWILSWR